MSPQSVIESVNRNVSPTFAYVENQVTIHLAEEPLPPEVLSFYIQIRRVTVGLYKAILITGKDILVNEFKNRDSYRICVQFVPVFTNQYVYVEFAVRFEKCIKEQFDKLVQTPQIYF